MYNMLDECDVKSLQNGYCNRIDGTYTCIVCGAKFQQGEVYRINGRLLHGETAAKIHVMLEHGEQFELLLEKCSEILPFSMQQKEIVTMLYSGASDDEIAENLNVSPSQVEKQRTEFKEQAKHAKLFLAMYELATKKAKTICSTIK